MSYAGSTRVTLFSGVISVENLSTKGKKLNELKWWLMDRSMVYNSGVPITKRLATQL